MKIKFITVVIAGVATVILLYHPQTISSRHCPCSWSCGWDSAPQTPASPFFIQRVRKTRAFPGDSAFRADSLCGADIADYCPGSVQLPLQLSNTWVVLELLIIQSAHGVFYLFNQGASSGLCFSSVLSQCILVLLIPSLCETATSFSR